MIKVNRDKRRQNRVRKDLKSKSGDRCRLTVFRSSKHIYAQIIDDTSGKTLVSASSFSKDFKEKGSDINGASKVGNLIGEKGKLLTENLQVSVSFYNDKPISIDLPNQVTCQISTTDVALKGQTVSSSYKPATLSNGLNIQVPPFIESGDEIIIDTNFLKTLKYTKTYWFKNV